jgi:lipoprotein-anchoring transpeptidase ErfK/SrfK
MDATTTFRITPSAPAGIPPRRPSRLVRLVLTAIVTVMAAGACSGPSPAAPDEATVQTPTPGAGPALVARAMAGDVIEVYSDPADGAPVRTLPATTRFGFPTVALVTSVGHDGPRAGWLEVLVPERPNGATGWVRSDAVETREVTLEVIVDLAARELQLLDSGATVLRAPVAVGTAEHPTPTGRFFVTDKLETPDPNGPYGPYAIGISAHSDALTEFAGGPGQIGIHGTNEPGSIGRAASRGCVRVADEVVERLAHLLPLGTPVTIV